MDRHPSNDKGMYTGTGSKSRKPGGCDDVRIIRAIVNRDERGVELLLDTHTAKARRVLAACTPDPDWMLIEECIHDAALIIWESPNRFDLSRGALGPFLAGIALRLYKRARRSESDLFRESPKHRPLDHYAAPPEIEPLMREKHWALSRAIRGVIEEMPANRREVLESDLAESSLRADTAELANRLGTTRSHIRKIRHDAKRDLEKWFRDHFLPREEGAA